MLSTHIHNLVDDSTKIELAVNSFAVGAYYLMRKQKKDVSNEDDDRHGPRSTHISQNIYFSQRNVKKLTVG